MVCFLALCAAVTSSAAVRAASDSFGRKQGVAEPLMDHAKQGLMWRLDPVTGKVVYKTRAPTRLHLRSEKETKADAMAALMEKRRDKTEMIPGRCAGEAPRCKDHTLGRWHLAGGVDHQAKERCRAQSLHGCKWIPPRPVQAACDVRRQARRDALPICRIGGGGGDLYAEGKWVRNAPSHDGCTAPMMAGYHCDHYWLHSHNAAGFWLQPRPKGLLSASSEEWKDGKYGGSLIPRQVAESVYHADSDKLPFWRAEDRRMRRALLWEWQPAACDLRPLEPQLLLQLMAGEGGVLVQAEAAAEAEALQLAKSALPARWWKEKKVDPGVGGRGGGGGGGGIAPDERFGEGVKQQALLAARARGEKRRSTAGRAPRRILFAGDSLTEQLYDEVRCVLGEHVHGDSESTGVVAPTLELPSGAIDSLKQVRQDMEATGLKADQWKLMEYFEPGLTEFYLGGGGGEGGGGGGDGEGGGGQGGQQEGRVGLFRANNLLRTLYEFDRKNNETGKPPPPNGPVFDRAWALLLAGSGFAGSADGQRLAPMSAGDVLVLNAGAHFATFGEHAFSHRAVDFWRATAASIAKHFDGLVVFRTLYTGMENCEVMTAPFQGAPREWAQKMPEMPYNWGMFNEWNVKIREAFEASSIAAGKFAVLNVTAFSYRGDARKLWIWHEWDTSGKFAKTGLAGAPFPRGFDCLHFSAPGPLREMLRLFSHFLVELLPDPWLGGKKDSVLP